MKALGRKGNWNQIAGTAKHQPAAQSNKELKPIEEKIAPDQAPVELGKSKTGVHKKKAKK